LEANEARAIPPDLVSGAAPALAVCGFSGSGKTTLLERAIPELLRRGLAVAVVKHASHGFAVDTPGKDSDRFFRAGATVSLRGPVEQFERRSAPLSVEVTLARLGCDHDLLLVEGHKETPLPKFWLASSAEPAAPEGVTDIVSVLPRDASGAGEGRLKAFLDYIDRWLPQAWNARPLRRGLLLGGASSRMGSPKQLLSFGGRPLGEIAAAALRTTPEEPGFVLLGAREFPSGGAHAAARLPDAAEFAGPGAGMIAAHRWAPQAAWIMAACDHPWLRREHIEWLAKQRQPGRWAVIPTQRDGHPSPMLALYEPQALEAMERMALAHPKRNASASSLLELPRTAVVAPPAELADGWINVNTPEELRAEEQKLSPSGERAAE
jgi:molybdopterin-guanine dinucleotide biosynthesis protein A